MYVAPTIEHPALTSLGNFVLKDEMVVLSLFKARQLFIHFDFPQKFIIFFIFEAPNWSIRV